MEKIFPLPHNYALVKKTVEWSAKDQLDYRCTTTHNKNIDIGLSTHTCVYINYSNRLDEQLVQGQCGESAVKALYLMAEKFRSVFKKKIGVGCRSAKKQSRSVSTTTTTTTTTP